MRLDAERGHQLDVDVTMDRRPLLGGSLADVDPHEDVFGLGLGDAGAVSIEGGRLPRADVTDERDGLGAVSRELRVELGEETERPGPPITRTIRAALALERVRHAWGLDEERGSGST